MFIVPSFDNWLIKVGFGVCATAHDAAKVVQEWSQINQPSGVLAMSLDQESRLRNLIRGLRGRKQEAYLRLLCREKRPVAIEKILKTLGLAKIEQFNGVFGGLRKACKRAGIDGDLLVERFRSQDGKTALHQATDVLLNAWEDQKS